MIHGSLDRLHLGDLLQWLRMGRVTGRLSLIEHSRKRHLDFLEGQVVYASSGVPEERLASWFATEGLLPVSLLRRLLAVSLVRRTPFTGLLLDQGGFSPEHLRRSLTRLAATIASRVLDASEVRFAFDPSYPVRQLLGLTLQVDPNVLVMEAARRSDEHHQSSDSAVDTELPFDGEAFDSFFWELIREAITDEDPADGEQLLQLQRLLRGVMKTLSRWLATGPGLVPLPPLQSARVHEHRPPQLALDAAALPQAVWNQMVLACSIRTPHLQHPETLQELLEYTGELAVLKEMSTTDLWRRPQAGRIDQLTAAAAADWSRVVSAVAPHVGVAADTATLAAHLVVVPTDLVLWVLSTLPITHRRLRAALVRELPRRIGTALVHLADFPELFHQLFEHTAVTPLGASLQIAREALPNAQLWPATVPDDNGLLLTVISPGMVSEALSAARRALEASADSPAAAG